MEPGAIKEGSLFGRVDITSILEASSSGVRKVDYSSLYTFKGEGVYSSKRTNARAEISHPASLQRRNRAVC